MSLKVDTINDAYSQLRISGLTVQPSPEDLEVALTRFENMMAELEDTRNMCLNYNFEEFPDPNTDSGLKRSYKHMAATNLAVRLIPDFNKTVPPALMAQANQSMSSVSGAVAADNIREVQYPRRQPRGSGNTLRFNRWQRFYRPTDLPKNDCDNNKMTEGDINDYQEPFTAYLRGEVISSFTIEETDGLSILSSSNTDDVVSYRVEAKDISSSGVTQSVTITITTDSGRVNIRLVEFEVSN